MSVSHNLTTWWQRRIHVKYRSFMRWDDSRSEMDTLNWSNIKEPHISEVVDAKDQSFMRHEARGKRWHASGYSRSREDMWKTLTSTKYFSLFSIPVFTQADASHPIHGERSTPPVLHIEALICLWALCLLWHSRSLVQVQENKPDDVIAMPSAWVRNFFYRKSVLQTGHGVFKTWSHGIMGYGGTSFYSGTKSQGISARLFCLFWVPDFMEAHYYITRLSQILKQAILLIHLTKSIKAPIVWLIVLFFLTGA